MIHFLTLKLSVSSTKGLCCWVQRARTLASAGLIKRWGCLGYTCHTWWWCDILATLVCPCCNNSSWGVHENYCSIEVRLKQSAALVQICINYTCIYLQQQMSTCNGCKDSANRIHTLWLHSLLSRSLPAVLLHTNQGGYLSDLSDISWCLVLSYRNNIS